MTAPLYKRLVSKTIGVMYDTSGVEKKQATPVIRILRIFCGVEDISKSQGKTNLLDE